MTAKGATLEYFDEELRCLGEVFRPEKQQGQLPVVLVVHAWDGLGDEVRGKASRLAAQGYIAFAIDVHGAGTLHTDFSTVQDVLGPFMADRAMLLKRLRAALAAAKTIEHADMADWRAMISSPQKSPPPYLCFMATTIPWCHPKW